MAKDIQEQLKNVNVWQTAFNEDGHIDDEHRITITEAFASPDAPILFPRVINRVLREAQEPNLLVTPLLSVVRLGQGRSMEFPAVNAIQASEIPEGQEYPEQALAFAKQIEGKVSKKGVKVSFTQEVIDDALWDIVGLHVRAAGRAMGRLKEQIALKRFKAAAVTVFDNASTPKTTGVGVAGTANDTLCWDDVIEMAASLMAGQHIPTDFILHPLMWAIFLKDPIFRPLSPNQVGDYNLQISGNGFYKGWAAGANVANTTAPVGLNVIVSPFVSFTAKSGNTPAKSDVYLIDRNDIGVLLVKDDLSVDDWTDQTRDIRTMKMKERYDVVCLGGAEGITVAKDVSLAKHYEVELRKTVS